MLSSFLSGSDVNLFVAFVAGFVTFFASCLLPLVPTYLAYLSGVALNSNKANENRFQIIKVAFFFVLGFITTFVVLSLTINLFSGIFSYFRDVVAIIGGFVFIILGLFMLGVFKHRIFSQERRLNLKVVIIKLGQICRLFGRKKSCWADGLDVDEFFVKYKNIHALLTGIVFGFAWTPCIGPVLAVILFWSAQAASAFEGVMLLVVYGLGLGVPFMLVAIGFEKVVPLLKRYAKISLYVSYLSGIIIIFAGLAMVSGYFGSLAKYIFH